ncbi:MULTISPECIES: zinc metalloprotease [Tenacibaculum]|uniref:zinc metalloprotease n=1 Tax=Tenacibaculum TaxID=104267 RepID=UPI001F0B06D6|nr:MULTISPECIES: zinc metalloprotease [Tenacibaculum]MCH3881405.1 zinc metalloprotease [Tenacibaculum aquimarinum]MDO6599001.1 zinc metalloprotease [Tenacibaculum sp. 1_MG-2023]
MKKVFLSLVIATGVFIGCQDSSNENPSEQQAKVDMSDFYLHTDVDETAGRSANGTQGKGCHTMNVLNKQLQENPGLYKKMYDVEYASRKFLAAKGKPGGGNGNGNGNGGGGTDPTDPTDPVDDGLGVINIPVYVHVVYSNSQQNISNAQITSQMTVLNNDFRMQNSDASNTPAEFADDAADAEVTFTLAGTFRHSNSTSSWGTNNAVKSAYPPVTPETHLNIWVAEIGGGILGYAQFPGGNLATDGVVCAPQYFGTTGYVSAPFDGGRTMTHEVGHYLNLRHIWGDGRCKQDDFVADTPSSDGPNYGCPSYPTVNCRTNDMTMNYMDYTDDSCMSLFTVGQKDRMRSIFAPGGAREAILN